MQNWNFKQIYIWPFKQQLIIFLMLFVSVLYAGYIWDLSAKSEILSNAKGEEADFKQQFEVIINKEIKLKKEISHLGDLKTTFNEWQKKLIKYTGLPDLMNEILKIGANNRLYFTLFNPEDEVKEEAYSKVPIKVTVVGSYNAFSDFLSQVANLPNIVVIRNFIISTEAKNDALGSKLAQQAAQQNLLTADVTLEIYQIPEVKPETKPETKTEVKPEAKTETKPETTPNAKST